jgi:hypothetical protein
LPGPGIAAGGGVVNRTCGEDVNGLDTGKPVSFFELPQGKKHMKQWVTALIAVAFASVALAQGAATSTPAAKAPETSSSTPAKSQEKKSKEKKQKKAKKEKKAKQPAGATVAPADKPAK